MLDLITVKVKDDESNLTKRFPFPPMPFQVSHDDPILKEMVDEAVQEFKGEPLEITVKVTMNW